MTQPVVGKKPLIQSCDELPPGAFHRLLLMGLAKDGKSYTTVSTCEGAKKEGAPEVCVINCDDSEALRALKDDGWRFDTVFVPGDKPQLMFDALGEIRRRVTAGQYKTVILDTLSKYSWRSLLVYEDATRTTPDGPSDGRRFWNNHYNHVMQVVDNLLNLPAHVVVNTHWADFQGKLIDGQAEKSGEGIVPHLPGKLREQIGSCFANIVFLEVSGLRGQESRRFLWKRMGQYGPGGRTLPAGVTSCEADVRVLWDMIQKRRESK